MERRFAGVARGQASVAGDWTGGISINGGVLHLAIHIAKTDDGYQGTLDSIDQGARGIPITSVALTGTSLTLKVGAVNGTYEGTVSADGTTIDGSWSQGGGSVSLVLTRGTGAAAPEPKRPQNPAKPYPYREEAISFDNTDAGITLAATLTIPAGAGPFPAVLLITGSGPQDRNESLAGHHPFLVLAGRRSRARSSRRETRTSR